MKRFTSRNTADQYQVKEHNLSILLDRIWCAGRPISRSELKKLSGLNKMTVCNLVAQLEEWSLVQKSGVYQPRSSGRPGLLYEINPESGHIIGVEVGVGNIYVVLTNAKGDILWRIKKPVQESRDVFLQTEELIAEAITEARSYDVQLLGIGVAVAALVSNEGEITLYPGSLGPVVNVFVNTDWQEKFGLPVFVTNDGNASAVGEQLFGGMSDFEDDFIFINVGEGLGAGIISNGDIFTGAGGFAGEIGHMTIELDGMPCKCGNRGCWENYVSLTTTLERWVSHPKFDAVQYRPLLTHNSEEDFCLVVKAAQDGDRAALETLGESGRYLGIGLAGVVNIFNPRHIFLGGHLCQASSFLMEPLLKEMEGRCFKISRANLLEVAVVKNPLDIAVMGAVAFVIRDLLQNPTRWRSG